VSDGTRGKLSFVGALWVPRGLAEETIPVKRVVSPTRSSKDIAEPAVFLAPDLSVYVTGHIIMADGDCRTV
jgi:NAD(P)-dependent dehydrogenase (short-subunit alcohol dehydrogenase family)